MKKQKNIDMEPYGDDDVYFNFFLIDSSCEWSLGWFFRWLMRTMDGRMNEWMVTLATLHTNILNTPKLSMFRSALLLSVNTGAAVLLLLFEMSHQFIRETLMAYNVI